MAVLATPLIGAQTTRRTAEKEFALGTTALGTDGKTWTYVRASGTVAVGTCTLDLATFLVTDAAGLYTSEAAFAADEYGWIYKTASPL